MTIKDMLQRVLMMVS